MLLVSTGELSLTHHLPQLLEPIVDQDDFGAERCCEIGVKHLHRHPTPVFHVLGEVDGRHATSAYFPVDGVTVGQGGLQVVKGLGHDWLR